MSSLASSLACVWGSAVAFVVIGALHRASRPRRPDDHGREPPTSLVVVRPCAGEQPWLEQALLSTGVASRMVRDARIVFAVADPGDPAAPIAARAAARLRADGANVAVVFTHPGALNAKSEQLDVAIRGAREELVVVADSDVDLDERSLASLLQAVAAGADAAWASPTETAARTSADHASRAVLRASWQSFSFLGLLDAGGFVGKLFAIRRAELTAIGGFTSSALGEDVELARRLRSRHARVERVDAAAWSLAEGRTWSEAIRRYARWIQVVRVQRPLALASYPLLFLSTPWILGLAAVGWSLDPVVAFVGAALALAGRVATGALATNRASSPRQARRGVLRAAASLVVDLVLADLLLHLALVLALFTSTVPWRGRTYALRQRRWLPAPPHEGTA